MNPDYKISQDFLNKWSSQGPWVLTAIKPDRKGICTQTFYPDSTELYKWLDKYGQDHNIYFHVNPVIKDLDKKATREDIKEMAWLHVDIDPRAGENLHDERKRALELLQNPPGDLPKPTAIVFSGGGYQGFWKLRVPIEILGKEEAFEEAKRYNIQLEILFGADNCHNVDRIMRLPGTINRPDAKKKEKGRTEKLAELIEFHEDRIYDLKQFTPAAPVQQLDSGFSSKSIQVSGNIERLQNVDDPRLNAVSDLAKVVIVQGNDPENPDKFPSRSEALFYVCCEMVRAECSNDTIYAVITDPDFNISSSVLDKGGASERYALRQIERAREQAIAPELRELNERHAVIGNWNGKCRVIEEVYDHTLGRFKLTRQTFEDIRNRYMHRLVSVTIQGKAGPEQRFLPLGKWWLNHTKRRQYDTLIFAPGCDVKNAYNLWRGFACDAKPGNCELFFQHIRDNLCSGDISCFNYIMGWLANAVQKPNQPGYSAVVLRGRQGTGKSFFAKTIGSIFGRHFLHVSDPKHLVGSFNAHLRDCVILFGDEAFYAGDKKHESVLKMLITEDMLVIEPKGVDAEMSTNCVHLIMASNDEWVVPAGLDDRRFFVLDVCDTRKEDTKYFKEIQDQLDAGGREALLHYLMTFDLKNFDVRKVPKTKALQAQKLLSMGPIEEWWYSKLKSGILLDEHEGWETLVLKPALQQDFISYAKDYNLTKRGNATKLGQTLVRFLPSNYPKTEQQTQAVEVRMSNGAVKNIKRPYYYVLPSLEECRDYWDEKFGGPYSWPKQTLLEERSEVPF